MKSSPDTTNSTDTDGTPPKPSIHLTIPPRLFILPGSALILGAMIGLRRGARTAALQFLAENVHRPPTTVRGWYFYNKTKNYRVLMAGMKESGKEAARLGATAGVWVALEEGCERVDGLAKEAEEVIAAVGTASVFSVVYRLPWKTAQRALGLGLVIGAVLRGLRWGRDNLAEQAAAVAVAERRDEDDGTAEPSGGESGRG